MIFRISCPTNILLGSLKYFRQLPAFQIYFSTSFNMSLKSSKRFTHGTCAPPQGLLKLSEFLLWFLSLFYWATLEAGRKTFSLPFFFVVVCFFTLLLGLVKLIRPRSHLHLSRAVFSPGSVSLGQTPKLQGLPSLLPSFFAFFEPTLSSLIFQPTKPHISLVLHKTDQMNSFPLCLTKRLMIQEFKE